MRVFAQPAERLRFDCFEANLDTGELRKHGVRVKLHDQPFQILTMLLARPGEMVTREEIQQRLWPSGTFVDFENGMNRAVNRLRDALGDSADQPKFIETIPRHGYRFLVPVERLNGHRAPVAELKPEPTAQPSKQWRWLAAAVVAAVLVLAGVGATRFHRAPKAILKFSPRDWVLISSFENRTGNPILDGTLEYALERELSNSQFVNVVPRERITDVLKLMRKPPATKIDAALGREICLRDGGIRALLTGRVEKIGTTYVLSTQLVDPANGVAVASISEEDPADSQTAVAVRRLSNRVRETLGEKTAQIQQNEKRLEKVTTPSLHALQLYTQAEQLMHSEEGQAAAAELLKQALAEDPNFASAHLLLGYTFENRGRGAEAVPEYQRAFDLASSTPDRERFFILASYYEEVQRDEAKAIEAYKALLQLYPDHYWAASNLTELYLNDGRWDDSWRLSVHLADLRPDDVYRNRVAACGKFLSNDPSGAMPYLERVRVLAATDKNPSPDDFVELLPVFSSWSAGNLALAHRQLQEKSAGLPLPSAAFYWAFGESVEAEKEVQKEPDDAARTVFMGLGAYLKGDLAAARRNFAALRHNRDQEQRCSGCTAVAVEVQLGLWNQVERSIRASPAKSPGVQIVRGERALALGKTKVGIALLEKGVEAMHGTPVGAFYLGSETLARTYEKQGDLEAALRVLQQASNAKGKAFSCLSSGPMTGAWG
jgi:DNA-binding winged helix-turn-helix (wHTH) protein/tetratricopeptide (TPR) repeat protein